MSLVQRIALKVLGLNLDTAKLAKRLANPESRFDTALEILKLTKESWSEARKSIMKGSKELYAQAVLKIPDRETLTVVLKWLQLSKEQKVEKMLDAVQELADDGDSPRSFFTGVYTRYLTYKRRNGSKWKDVAEAKEHLVKAQNILNLCIHKDSMSLDEFHKLCIYSYFYFKLKLVGQKKKDTPIITMNTEHSQLRKAA